jgi:hypothetical protein
VDRETPLYGHLFVYTKPLLSLLLLNLQQLH